MHHSPDRRGFALTECLALAGCCAVLLAVSGPTWSLVRGTSHVSTSLDRLQKIGIAHAVYAADYGGRQYTNTVDDITSYGPSLTWAFSSYEDVTGEPHPPVIVGDYCDDDGCSTYAYWMSHPGNYVVGVPFNFPANPGAGFGWFRIPNARPLHAYLDNRVYSHSFFTPGDTVAFDTVRDLLAQDQEFIPAGSDGNLYWSSYALSPAALMDPAVMRTDAEGGWQDPWDLDYGYRAPGLFQAEYPALKTQMIEHHWNQDAPADRCNPAFTGGTYDGCEPYFFNHGWESKPATLFYDLSVRVLPVTEAVAADEQVMKATGEGLWKRDTPLGADGYLSEYAFDDVRTSFHVLTTEGILGRDTVGR